MSSRRPSRWIYIVAAVVMTLAAYPLSVGPVTCLEWHTDLPNSVSAAINTFYAPLNAVVCNGPRPLKQAFEHYVNWWTPNGTRTEEFSTW